MRETLRKANIKVDEFHEKLHQSSMGMHPTDVSNSKQSSMKNGR